MTKQLRYKIILNYFIATAATLSILLLSGCKDDKHLIPGYECNACFIVANQV